MAQLSPHAFVAKWRSVTVKERSGYQEHFIDLCHLVGHPTPLEDDPVGTRYAFEAGAGKQQGGQGWADVWKRGFFAWEYKGKHANLDRAYQQLLQYRESLQNPPLLVVSDMATIQIHTNFTNTVKQMTVLTLDDLLTPDGLQRLRDLFWHPDAFRATQTTELVTQQAAREFAQLATLQRRYGHDPQRTAHFLIRLLFCLFAEDSGLLPNQVFAKLIKATRSRAPLFTEQLGQLFAAMNCGGFFAMEDIPHFDGRLFDNAEVLPLDSESMAILQRVSELDWSSIEPSILGTLFERSLDPAKRSQLGAHYTSRDDILLIIEPVLMAPLRRRWAAVAQQARELAVQRDAARGNQAKRLQNELQGLLQGFADEIAATRVLDPACGSGNFLFVALKQMLDLEKEVISLAQDLAAGGFFPRVSPEQLYGIEINEYAHELAQVTVWIGYIQWLRDNGFGQPAEPILKPLDTIQRMDAILAYDETGQPVEPAWPAADVIVGNPPFLGGKRLRSELGDTYVETIFVLYKTRVPHEADLVIYWFERARALIEQGQVKRTGLLATQAIRGGANRKVLERIKASGDIFMAWSDRPWIVEGAAVRVSMIGFDQGIETIRTLDGLSVASINANLTTHLDLTKAQRLLENMGIAFMGDTKGGAFDLTPDQAVHMLNAPLNPNGRPNSDVVRPWLNGKDVTARPRGMFIIDFGVDMSEADAALYEEPFAYVEREVKPERINNKRAAYRDRWWIHVESRPALRQALNATHRFIVTPRVAKHRLFAWASRETLPDSRLYVFCRDDDYFFGILHSQVHEVWSLATSSRHGVGNDPTYNNSTCFETFPLPWPPGHEPEGDARVEAIARAARRLVELRNNWLNPEGASEAELKQRTLTNLYNQRPTWLANAHRTLDEAVLAAYGWPVDLSDEAILARLLALNLERAGNHGDG
ncbi:class I SAM-dependent DNA methyltransferase [Candidatus Chloroploca asiatica]|uniref:site-specific DNA-methyltransferase (adenine-specific) n=1 Tax=Candidatus Chloroploca asiatica TaxID=1506545 RepID=A0A2H3KI58_9CHLR|nr:class I SAM-dependent DNA methyltransferase [Candidatus Chloroploca asiatica]PDV97486.1 DNA methyltransferase [Candidatus Chloroploca asiatica]